MLDEDHLSSVCRSHGEKVKGRSQEAAVGVARQAAG